MFPSCTLVALVVNDFDKTRRHRPLLQGGNLKVDVLQLVQHRPRGIEQLESDIVILSPSLQKHQCADAPTADGVHFCEVQNDNAGACLRRNRLP
jgi:hypothetical protein